MVIAGRYFFPDITALLLGFHATGPHSSIRVVGERERNVQSLALGGPSEGLALILR